MTIKAILFDLDGTLLPMDQAAFVEAYFKSLSAYISKLGYEPKKLIETVISATYAMKEGDGRYPNEKIFWDVFCSVYGESAINDKAEINGYYEKDFDLLKEYTSVNPLSKKTVEALKNKGYRLILATNPLFPPLAIAKRLNWAGLKSSDFELCTTYDNSSYCKPNPLYYKEITEKFGLNPCECIMVGNDVDDDMTAREAGLEVFLMTDNLINRKNKDISAYPSGGFKELLEFIEKN